MTIPTKAQVDALFEKYTNSVIMDKKPKEIAKLKSAYEKAHNIRIGFKLAGGARERKEN